MDELPYRESSGATKQGIFYRVLHARLVYLATRARLQPAQAEDAIQSVWLKFCRRFPGVAGEDVRPHHRAWLLLAVKHEIIDVLRAAHRHRTRPLSVQDEEWRDSRATDSAISERDERALALFRRWMAELRHRDPLAHELVSERYLNGIRIAELAQRTGQRAHWISSRIHRALKKFRLWASRQPNDDDASP